MGVKQSIFSSNGEKRGFRSIEHTWGESYRVVPQFPMSALFTPDPSWKKGDTSNLFFKTSFDYVLATDEGRPLIAIDFDGMGAGFDRLGKYVQVEATPDRNRRAKFDFKLSYAQRNEFPYHIVASEEFEHLGEDVELTLVDSLIGATIARLSFNERLPSLKLEHADILDNLRPSQQSEYIQDLVISLEIECESEHNPIVQKTATVLQQIAEITGSFHPCSEWSYSYFEIPEAPYYDFFSYDVEQFRRRVEALERADWQGCVVTLRDTPVGDVSEVVQVRNLGCGEIILSDVAELMAWSKLLRLLRRRHGQD